MDQFYFFRRIVFVETEKEVLREGLGSGTKAFILLWQDSVPGQDHSRTDKRG